MQSNKRINTKNFGTKPNVMSERIIVKKNVGREPVKIESDIHVVTKEKRKGNKRHEGRTAEETRA